MPTRKSTPVWLSAIAAAVLVGGIASACSPDTNPPTQPVDTINTIAPASTTTDAPTTDAPTTDAPTTATIAPAPETAIPAPPPVDTQAGCGSDFYINSDGQCVHDPVAADSPPAGATAKCNDGTYSFSKHHSGTCSGHHGVAEWLS
jgi:hypothetical protein